MTSGLVNLTISEVKVGLKVVQIGANRGKDDLSQMLQLLPANVIDRLVLVEPLEVHHQALEESYQWIDHEIHALAIATGLEDLTNGSVDFYYHLDDAPGFEVASLDPQHIAKHARFNPLLADEKRLMRQEVSCVTLADFLDHEGLLDLDILFMDCEGADGDIVQSLGSNVAAIRNIYFENCHLRDESVYAFLQEQGMEVVRNCLTNGWMSHAFHPRLALNPVSNGRL